MFKANYFDENPENLIFLKTHIELLFNYFKVVEEIKSLIEERSRYLEQL